MTKHKTPGPTEWALKVEVTRQAKFLAELDAVARKLRIRFMQQCFNLSDPAMEDAPSDSESMRRFAAIDPTVDLVPGETTILRFRHLLEQHRLAEKLFAEVRALLQERHLLLKSGTIFDATTIAAPPSTKNATGSRDPDMKQTREGRQWHFGMKVHVGTDRRGLVHSVATGPASEGDITRLDELLQGEEREFFGDRVYWSEDHRQQCRHAGIRYRVNRRAKPGRTLSEDQKGINRSRSRQRTRGEHAVPCRQNPAGLQRSAPSRAVQEHGAGGDAVRVVEPVSGATIVVSATGKVRLARDKKP